MNEMKMKDLLMKVLDINPSFQDQQKVFKIIQNDSGDGAICNSYLLTAKAIQNYVLFTI